MKRALSLAAVLLASPAAAQQSTGTLIPDRDSAAFVGSIGELRTKAVDETPITEPQPSEAAFVNGRGMAACVLKRRPRDAADLLRASDIETFGFVVRRMMPTLQICSGAQAGPNTNTHLGLSKSAMRGLIADARFRKQGLPRLSPIPYSSVIGGSDWITVDLGQKVVLRTADCLAAREPERVLAVLYAAPDSVEEKTAFAELAPMISSCLEKNVTLAAKRTGMRLAFASAIDRRMGVAEKSAGKPN